jgi:glutathione S-transferase
MQTLWLPLKRLPRWRFAISPLQHGNTAEISSSNRKATLFSHYLSPSALLTIGCNRILGIPRVETKELENIWNELHSALKVMDGILSGRSYLGGAEFTLVDIWSMPWVSQLIDLKGAEAFFAELPHLRNWWERVSLRPAWKEACGLMDEAMEVMRQNATNGWEL